MFFSSYRPSLSTQFSFAHTLRAFWQCVWTMNICATTNENAKLLITFHTLSSGSYFAAYSLNPLLTIPSFRFTFHLLLFVGFLLICPKLRWPFSQNAVFNRHWFGCKKNNIIFLLVLSISLLFYRIYVVYRVYKYISIYGYRLVCAAAVTHTHTNYWMCIDVVNI